VILTDKGLYYLPSGGMEEDKSSEKSLRREQIEETGHNIRVVSFIGEALRYFITSLKVALLNQT
jgi:8-oxo-dGTP diphosphatase